MTVLFVRQTNIVNACSIATPNPAIPTATPIPDEFFVQSADYVLLGTVVSYDPDNINIAEISIESYFKGEEGLDRLYIGGMDTISYCYNYSPDLGSQIIIFATGSLDGAVPSDMTLRAFRIWYATEANIEQLALITDQSVPKRIDITLTPTPTLPPLPEIAELYSLPYKSSPQIPPLWFKELGILSVIFGIMLSIGYASRRFCHRKRKPKAKRGD